MNKKYLELSSWKSVVSHCAAIFEMIRINLEKAVYSPIRSEKKNIVLLARNISSRVFLDISSIYIMAWV